MGYDFAFMAYLIGVCDVQLDSVRKTIHEDL